MSDFAAKRTAAFLRLLAEELVPQNKLFELVRRLHENLRFSQNMPEDFTGVEMQMAKTIGLTEKELDEACAERVEQLKKEAEAARKRSEAAWDYQRADEAKRHGLEQENMRLRSALEHLGFPQKKAEHQ
jgi:hypothetical protein